MTTLRFFAPGRTGGHNTRTGDILLKVHISPDKMEGPTMEERCAYLIFGARMRGRRTLKGEDKIRFRKKTVNDKEHENHMITNFRIQIFR
jgi:hypothetical protein